MRKNFIINATVVGMERQGVVQKANSCNVPWAILLDPVSSCNLYCKGCWAAEYDKNLRPSLELWDSVIPQGKVHEHRRPPGGNRFQARKRRACVRGESHETPAFRRVLLLYEKEYGLHRQ